MRQQAPSLFLVLSLATLACGGQDGPCMPSTTALSLTVAPNPLTATGPFPGDNYETNATLTIRETAGIGGTVETVVAQLSEASRFAGRSIGQAGIAELLGTNHIRAHGSLSGSLSLRYPGPRQGTITFIVQFTDDRGRAAAAAVAAKVL